MFSGYYENLSLTSPDAEPIFGESIVGCGFNGDTTFLATLRAIVFPRLQSFEKLHLNIRDAIYEIETFASHSETKFVSDQAGRFPSNSLSIIHTNALITANRNFAHNAVKKQFLTVYRKDGFIELEDLREFASKYGDMLFFVSEKEKSSVVFVKSLNVKTLHFLQSLVSRLLPWYFADQPLSDKERQLVKSLTRETPDEYLRLIEEFAQEYDFRNAKIERLLTGFETKTKKLRLSDVQADLINIENDIETNIRCYRELLGLRQSKMIEEDGLKVQIKNADQNSEVMDYFKTNKNLDLVDVCQDSVSFIVKCYLENFDCDMYERYVSNKESYMWDSRYYEATHLDFYVFDNRKILLDAIFSDEPLLKVKICAFYNIGLQGWVDTQSGYVYPITYADRIANPHLQYHACLGDQRPLIEEALRNGDTVRAIEQCICSARSLNIGEGCTAKHLLRQLFSEGADKFIELPDGSSCTPSEALAWLESQNIESSEV